MTNDSACFQSKSSSTDDVASDETKDSFTNTQYKQLLNMIQTSFKELSTASRTHASSSNVWTAPSSHLACTVMHFACYANNNVPFSLDMWILDSGATDHIHLITIFLHQFRLFILHCIYLMVKLLQSLMLV